MLQSDIGLAEANRLYHDQRYSEALMMYESLLEENSQSAALHYNAGNACYRMRLYGRAVFHYRQAVALSPLDKDARNNLKLAESSLARPVPSMGPFSFSKFFREITGYVPLAVMAILALISWYFLMITAVIRMIRPGTAKKLLYPLILSATLFVLSSVIILGNRLLIKDFREAVILKPATEARAEPGTSGAAVFEAYEGWHAEITEESPEWIRIRMDNGKEGWIRRENAGIIKYD